MHFSMPPPHTRLRALQGLALACALLLGGCSTTPPYRPAPTRAAQLSDEQAHDIAIHALGLVGKIGRAHV